MSSSCGFLGCGDVRDGFGRGDDAVGAIELRRPRRGRERRPHPCPRVIERGVDPVTLRAGTDACTAASSSRCCKRRLCHSARMRSASTTIGAVRGSSGDGRLRTDTTLPSTSIRPPESAGRGTDHGLGDPARGDAAVLGTGEDAREVATELEVAPIAVDPHIDQSQPTPTDWLATVDFHRPIRSRDDQPHAPPGEPNHGRAHGRNVQINPVLLGREKCRSSLGAIWPSTV